jgi:hypothetical protein
VASRPRLGRRASAPAAPRPVVVDPALVVRWRDAAPTSLSCAVLGLDDDLEPLWGRATTRLTWVRATGTAAPARATVWQEVVRRWRSAVVLPGRAVRCARSSVTGVSRAGTVAARKDLRLGLPDAWVLHSPALSRAATSTPSVVGPGAGRRRRPGGPAPAARVGPFTAAQLLPLLGRPRPLCSTAGCGRSSARRSDAQVATRRGRWAVGRHGGLLDAVRPGWDDR